MPEAVCFSADAEDQITEMNFFLSGELYIFIVICMGNDYHVGPVFCSESSSVDVEYSLLQYEYKGEKMDVVSIAFRKKLTRVLERLPVIRLHEFSIIICMLEYFLNENSVTIEQLENLSPMPEAAQPSSGQNRQRIYNAERNMLAMVRNGDLNYKDAVRKASNLSYGVRIHQGESMRQMKISVETFITLCVRAAIEGSMSPEQAYSLGDSYIEKVEAAKDSGELLNVANTMYDDFIHRVHELRVNPAVSKEIRTVMNYIEIHPEEDITMEKLAKLAGYTEYYLSRKFKKEVNCSISDYINITRIERAKIMLTSSDESIAAIGEHLRYCTSSCFSATFKKITGKTPAEYRKSEG